MTYSMPAGDPRTLGVVPGSRVAIEIDGKLYTETVTKVSYQSAQPEIIRMLTLWQCVIHALTPRRWRKSLIVRPSQPACVTIETEPYHEPT